MNEDVKVFLEQVINNSNDCNTKAGEIALTVLSKLPDKTLRDYKRVLHRVWKVIKLSYKAVKLNALSEKLNKNK